MPIPIQNVAHNTVETFFILAANDQRIYAFHNVHKPMMTKPAPAT